MKKIILMLLLVAPFVSLAQKDSIITIEEVVEITDVVDYAPAAKDNDVFEVVEEMPVYPGGETARTKFINEHLVYPDSAVKYNKEGSIYVKFIVEPDSSLSNVQIIKSFDDYCSAEAIRVTKMMRWVPGRHRGKAVRVNVIMPIRFRLK